MANYTEDEIEKEFQLSLDIFVSAFKNKDFYVNPVVPGHPQYSGLMETQETIRKFLTRSFEDDDVSKEELNEEDLFQCDDDFDQEDFDSCFDRQVKKDGLTDFVLGGSGLSESSCLGHFDYDTSLFEIKDQDTMIDQVDNVEELEIPLFSSPNEPYSGPFNPDAVSPASYDYDNVAYCFDVSEDDFREDNDDTSPAVNEVYDHFVTYFRAYFKDGFGQLELWFDLDDDIITMFNIWSRIYDNGRITFKSCVFNKGEHRLLLQKAFAARNTFISYYFFRAYRPLIYAIYILLKLRQRRITVSCSYEGIFEELMEFEVIRHLVRKYLNSICYDAFLRRSGANRFLSSSYQQSWPLASSYDYGFCRTKDWIPDIYKKSKYGVKPGWLVVQETLFPGVQAWDNEIDLPEGDVSTKKVLYFKKVGRWWESFVRDSLKHLNAGVHYVVATYADLNFFRTLPFLFKNNIDIVPLNNTCYQTSLSLFYLRYAKIGRCKKKRLTDLFLDHKLVKLSKYFSYFASMPFDSLDSLVLKFNRLLRPCPKKYGYRYANKIVGVNFLNDFAKQHNTTVVIALWCYLSSGEPHSFYALNSFNTYEHYGKLNSETEMEFLIRDFKDLHMIEYVKRCLPKGSCFMIYSYLSFLEK